MSGLQEVDRISPVRPSPSLLTSARDRTGDNFGRGGRTVEIGGVEVVVPNWATGIEWNPTACAPSHPWPRCPVVPSGSDALEKEAPANRSKVGTDSFIVYTPMRCDWSLPETEILEEAAVELTDVHTAFAVAGALWLGEGLNDEITLSDGTASRPPTLRRSATDLGLGAVEFSIAVSELLRAYEECTGGNGGAVLHVPGSLVPYALGAGSGGGAVAVQQADHYVLRAGVGQYLSPGPGYPMGASAAGADGFGPKTSTDPDPEAYAGNLEDQSWIYLSGPVEYAVAPIKVLPEREVDRRQGLGRTNTVELYAERLALVRFDPCCVFAALVNTPLESGS